MDEVDGGDLDADHDLPGPGDRIGRLPRDEHLRPTELAHPHNPHDRSSELR
ncbi:hypothetical protein [Saccharopolyspora elongata]|uniref:hypothetical protein n=1 Tax=Saccharopolyspora elongata TaxID=2530387 RepID=UPI001F33D727|nr:hypothetical protein [Saccharopolyspora elongata]